MWVGPRSRNTYVLPRHNIEREMQIPKPLSQIRPPYMHDLFQSIPAINT